MTPEVGFTGYRWWKASEYEVIEGTHIAPAPDAEIETFPPFEAYQKYWSGKKRKGRTDLAYQELLELPLDDPRAITGWCQKYGLLGILPHRTLEAYFWPRWAPGFQLSGGMGAIARNAMGTHYPVQRHYRQDFGAQDLKWEFYHDPFATPFAWLEPEDVRRAVQSNPGVTAALQWPGVRGMRVWDGAPEHLSLATGYAQFFPRREGVVRWTASRGSEYHDYFGPKVWLDREAADQLEQKLGQEEYPIPGTPQFRREYGEPIALFCQYVRELRGTVHRWENAANAHFPAEVIDALQGSGRPSGSGAVFPAAFEAGLRPVRPGAELQHRDGELTWNWSWRSPSLYGVLNLMILQDFPLRGTMLKQCGGCGKPIVTDDARQEYCSDRCQNTAYMRRYRSDKDDDE